MHWNRRTGREWLRPLPQNQPRQPNDTARAKAPLLLALNLIALGLIAGVVLRLREDRSETRGDVAVLQQQAHAAMLAADGSMRRAEALVQTSQLEMEARLSGRDPWQDSARDLQADLGTTKDTAAKEIHARMSADRIFEQRLLALDRRLAAVQSQSDSINVFSRVEERAAPCVFLLHCTFDYRVVSGTPGELETGTGWGSGFLVSPDGLLITNKHVLQPWKFDPDLASMLAAHDIELVGSPRIYAWPCGERCMSPEGTPLLSRAYSSTGSRRLRVAGFAPDALRPIVRDSLGRITEPPLHELDNNDLALLQLDGGPYPWLPLAAPGRVRKLDRVMTLGYPRGQRGLESGVAQTSPSLGTVRKAEDTIHITASIIPGNSGGPLMDERGEVIGVVTRIYSETLGICLRAEVVQDFLLRTREASTDPALAGHAVLATRQSFYR